ncbi:sugar phosphate isomerase/epimerase family protein [Pseudothermotoga lettingae]|uniref:sugar phosphate isomerase/epimerase family protein n=1 Tax=Pseudothermotoga lettingae TaxID=177758 RepID=UPI0007496426|nr:sugar phosphate isomerase/epimerase [Pseudothermotoga lettingae]KUK19976.1 MAG: Xylose isomerase domain protein TIM barrel [Pseudothermotoga lettingae]
MKIGFLTVALGNLKLDDIVEWASKEGFEALEVAAWPPINERDFSSTTIDADNFSPKDAERIKALLEKHGLIISSLAYYDNNLDSDPEKRKKINEHLRKVIDVAHILGVELVGTFIGRDVTKSIEENMKEFEKVFKPLISYAESKNVKLMIENCPMVGWQEKEKIGNIFYSPQIWREIFRITPDSFGLNLDPSHLYWLGIDYLKVVEDFADRIFHVHAKDVEIKRDILYEQSIFGYYGTNAHGKSWWIYRLPGLGELDWSSFILELKKVGYDFVISIEHEDPIWGGDIEKSKKGLKMGLRFLIYLVVYNTTEHRCWGVKVYEEIHYECIDRWYPYDPYDHFWSRRKVRNSSCCKDCWYSLV